MGFHTNPTQNQRNMNAEWKRMEARAFFYGILKYHGLQRPAGRYLTGIVRDEESGLPVNGATVAFGGKTYTTDTYARLFNRYSSNPDELRNGYYYLEEVPAGPEPMTVTAPGYTARTLSVATVDTFFTFQDVALVSDAPVRVASANVAGASSFRIVDPVVVTFSRPVVTSTVQAGWTLAPSQGGAPVTGTFSWSSDNRRVVFTPSQALAALTPHTLTIGGSAASPYGYLLDGNGDGTAGDAYAMSFTTGPQDVTAPAISEVAPSNNGTNVSRQPLINVTFNERVAPGSRPASLFTLVSSATGQAVPIRTSVYDVGDRTVVNAAPATALSPGTAYQFRIAPGMQDAVGNTVTGERRLTFTTGRDDEAGTVLDAFDGDLSTRWWDPLQSGSTTGVVADSTTRVAAPLQSPRTADTGQAMQVKFGWDANASSSLARICFMNCAGPTATIDTTHVLQLAVFGDGSGTRLRLALDERCTGSTCAGSEAGPWTDVTWRGWRLVEWDLDTVAPPDAWIGTSNGRLEGLMRVESIQLSRPTSGTVRFGSIYVDDLRVVRKTPVASDEAETPRTDLALDAPMPNPTAGVTRLRYVLPAAERVRLAVYDVTGREVAVLAEGEQAAGTHVAEWDAHGVAPGAYLVRLATGTARRSATVVVR